MQDNNDLIYDYITSFLKSGKKISVRGDSDIYFAVTLISAKQGLTKIEPNKQRQVVELLKDFNNNQMAVFLENLRYDLEVKNGFRSIVQDTKDIKKGLFPKKLISHREHASGCINTYIGFMRALEAGTLYTAKVEINGKLKRVFVKTPIGVTGDVVKDAGYFKLLIDPETMDVYSFMTKAGKIDKDSLTKVYSKKNLEATAVAYNYDNYARYVLKNYKNFRKQLLEKVDEIYGLERMLNTFLRMGGKVDPNKYSNEEFKEELIRFLEQKVGKKKVLKLVKRIENSEQSAKASKEILKVLSKELNKKPRAKIEKIAKPKSALKRQNYLKRM